MSVVVRMERVPKNCDDGCWGSLSGECPWCDSINGYKMVGNRPPNCPIIAVLPEGHGRLVDAELVKEILKPVDSISHHEPEWTWGELHESNCVAIDNAPTIVPAERSEE